MKNLFSNIKDLAKGLAAALSQSKKLRYGIIIGTAAVILIAVTAFGAWSIHKSKTTEIDPIPKYDRVSVLGGGSKTETEDDKTDAETKDNGETDTSEEETDETSAADDETEAETEETAGTADETAEPETEPITPSEDNVETNEPVEVTPSVPAVTNKGEQNAWKPASTTSKTTQTGPKPTPTTKATQAEPKPTPTTTKQVQAEPKPTPTTTKQAQTEPKPTPTTTQKPQNNPGEILGTWTVKEKKYDYNGANVMILDVENQSSSPYTITITGHFKDASGKEIRTETKTFEGFPANYSNYFVFQPGIKFDSFSYDFVTSAYSGPAYAQYIICGSEVIVTPREAIMDQMLDTHRAELGVDFSINSTYQYDLYYRADFVLFDKYGKIFWIENTHGSHIISIDLNHGYKTRRLTYDDILYEDYVMPDNLKGTCSGIVAIRDIYDKAPGY